LLIFNLFINFANIFEAVFPNKKGNIECIINIQQHKNNLAEIDKAKNICSKYPCPLERGCSVNNFIIL